MSNTRFLTEENINPSHGSIFQCVFSCFTHSYSDSKILLMFNYSFTGADFQNFFLNFFSKLLQEISSIFFSVSSASYSSKHPNLSGAQGWPWSKGHHEFILIAISNSDSDLHSHLSHLYLFQSFTRYQEVWWLQPCPSLWVLQREHCSAPRLCRIPLLWQGELCCCKSLLQLEWPLQFFTLK